MQNKHRSEATAYVKHHSRRAAWQKVVSFLVSVTVFITTYTLILPALTMEKNVVCNVEEHIHEAACFSEEDASLVCTLEEHTHGDSCYEESDVEEIVGLQYICGNGTHSHEETCYGEDGALICSVPEHVHEASCVVEDLDLTADVETAAQWEASMNTVQLSGNWPRDVIKVATSQIGYTESAKNAIFSEGNLKGYTRYGEWYGDQYGDWNATFASFVLNYAGVKDIAANADVSELQAAVKEAQLYRNKDEYAAKAGDLVFFDWSRRNGEGDEVSDHVGIIAEITSERLITIEGDVNGAVDFAEYDIADAAIVGYGDTPSGSVIILEEKGEDYQVKVTMDQSAQIPDTAILRVREILAGTEEYETYYSQSVSSLLGESSAKSEEELGVSFVRFFDICFEVDGVETEPMAPVDIQITYDEAFEVSEEKSSVAVHFAEEGIEILDAMTSRSESENEVDTFSFTQNSFSVTGTIVTNNTKAANYYKKVNFNSLDSSGGTSYVVYTQYNGRYYALDGNGNAVEITFASDGVTIATDVTNNMLWAFSSVSGGYSIRNVGTRKYMHSFYNSANDNGVTTTGNYSSILETSNSNGETVFRVRSNNNYSYATTSGWNVTFGVTQQSASASRYYLAAAPQSTYHVWFDGTDGGLMGLYGSPNTYQAVPTYDNEITLPETWESPTKYSYKLNGWYDIVNHKHYAPGATVTVTENLVFYADWVASTYDVGVKNEHTVESLDTSDFITTYVFDYNVLFNALSLTHTGSISAAGHSETWSLVTNGDVPYSDGDGNDKSLGFVLLDYDAGGDISYANDRDGEQNYNRSVITPGILEYVENMSGESLVDLLFNPATSVIGKSYLGEGNYLFQYMDQNSPNYDGHDGYYYFHSRLNAASYNQSEQRFYLYDYLERTTDSRKDGGPGEFSDFLPFNSPYANIPDGQKLPTYTTDTGALGYMFDAKDAYVQSGVTYSSADNAGTNYWFGIRSDIEFFLPNNAGDKDEYDNYGNISTKGEHMVFEFHGDDDLWVFVDGELVLDVGGVHGVEYGNIDFSTGRVTSGEGAEEVTQTFEEVLGHNILEGTHTLTVYYMERGSSQSNCSIYFNIAPRYTLEITKEDVFTAEKLDGAEFTVYTDEACQHIAELWESEEAHNLDMDDGVVDNALEKLVVENGVASCWGISAGKTYYIKETKSPIGYPVNDDLIRITLNNRGTATIETTTLHGPDGEETEGFAVIKQDVNDTLKIVALTVTNQVDGDTTQVRVQKEWDESSVNIPNSIQVYLTVGGVRVGRMATLTEANGWSYKWTGLPKYDSDGVTLIEYAVEEVQVPGYETEHVQTQNVIERIDWIKTDAMADSTTYLLVNAGQALSYNGTSFSWVTPEYAKTDEGINAQWTVTTNQYGFRLTNGNGYNLTYEPNEGLEGDYFYGTTSTDITLNQVIYFLDSRLVAHDHDYYFQFNSDGDGVASDGLVFTLYRKDVLTGTLVDIKNTPIEEEHQTHVEVNKIWDDLLDHSADEITVYLYADGKDTGRYARLNQASGWKATFEGLPYYAEDGVTPVRYTVVEADVEGYTPSYSGPTVVAAKTFTSWVGADSLENGAVYRFVSGAYALATDEYGNLIASQNSLESLAQQWRVESRGSSFLLKNVAYDYYLVANDSAIYTTGNVNSASAVVLTGGILRVGSRYVILSSVGASSSWYENNGTTLSVAKQATVSAMPGSALTVTNYEAAYVLPNTGGEGISNDLYKFGGSLIAATASMYICEFTRKRRKKGGVEN